MEAAFATIAARGYHDTGITEIMQAARLGRGTFYLYFDNKRDMLDGVLDYVFEKIVEAVGVNVEAEKLDTAADFENALRTVAGNLFTLLDENPDLSIVVLRNGMIDEAITARMLGLADIFTATVTGYVQGAKESGVLDPAVDEASLALALTGFATAGLLRGLRGNFPPDERARYVETAVSVLRAFTVRG
ncbi:TetR/AcrR family transcriptional regulator [Nocardia concava]|uniref:TetR/AcrR family transcriptional regulator n=1 Tax=Nocardia concava TaxID=257281 RepID=UPI0006882DEF|nr:TetR/AcrR family transcriptional regulator [Nocardia concava]